MAAAAEGSLERHSIDTHSSTVGRRCWRFSLCGLPLFLPFMEPISHLPQAPMKAVLGLHGFPISATKSDSPISVKGRSVLNSGKPELRPKRRGAGVTVGSGSWEDTWSGLVRSSVGLEGSSRRVS